MAEGGEIYFTIKFVIKKLYLLNLPSLHKWKGNQFTSCIMEVIYSVPESTLYERILYDSVRPWVDFVGCWSF